MARRLHLAEPSAFALPARHHTLGQDFDLEIRAFTLADVAWLLSEGGEDWHEKIQVGNDLKLAVRILAHQVDNGGALCARFGWDSVGEALERQLIGREANRAALIGAIARAYNLGMDAPAAGGKKKLLLRSALSSTILLFGLFTGLAGGWLLWSG